MLAGKCGSCRHSTTSFIVVVAKTVKTSCQMVEILSFSGNNGNLRANFGAEKKYNEAFRGVCFREQARKLIIKCRLCSRPCPRI